MLVKEFKNLLITVIHRLYSDKEDCIILYNIIPLRTDYNGKEVENWTELLTKYTYATNTYYSFIYPFHRNYSRLYVYVHERKRHFVDKGHRGGKYLTNEISPSFLGQNATEI